MVSAKGLIYGSPGTEPLLDTCAADTPLVVQLFGSEPRFMVEATARLLDRGFFWFDINAGCSVPKVVKTGAGASLLRTPEQRELLCQLVYEMTRIAGPGRVGVKFRSGWEKGEDVSIALGQALQDAGAGWLTLHPRQARQQFSGQADWKLLTRLQQAVNLPVLASGDLLQAQDGLRCLEQTGVQGLMFARGALNDPKIFARYLQLEAGNRGGLPEDGAAVAGVLRRHAKLAREYGRGGSALMKMRTFAPRYLRGLPGAAALRKRLTLCHDWQELEAMLREIETLPAAGQG